MEDRVQGKSGWFREKLTPLFELSEGTRASLLAGLEEDWRKMPKEFKIRYLIHGGLDRCEAAGIEVPEQLLRAAGLLGSSQGESETRNE